MNTLKRTLKNVPKQFQCFDRKSCIQKIDTIEFIGDISPSEWNNHIVTEKGTADTNAIMLLARIVFHYRSIARPFQGDMWQQTNNELVKRLNLTKFQVTSGLIRLEKLGLIVRELRTVDTSFGRLPNVQFIAPVAEKVCAISVTKQNKKIDKSDDFFEKQGYGYQNSKGSPSEKPEGDPLENSYTLQRDLQEKKEAAEAIESSQSNETPLSTVEPFAAAADLNDDLKTQKLTFEQKPNSLLKLVSEDGIIKTTLSDNQVAYALKRLGRLSQHSLENYSADLPQEILAGLVDPQCFTGCGVEFHRKLNTLVKSVENGTWTTPSSMKLAKKTQEEVRIKEKNAPLDALKEQHRLAFCSYLHWEKIARCQTDKPAQQADSLTFQKEAWDEVVMSTTELKSLDSTIKLPPIPQEPQCMMMRERKTA